MTTMIEKYMSKVLKFQEKLKFILPNKAEMVVTVASFNQFWQSLSHIYLNSTVDLSPVLNLFCLISFGGKRLDNISRWNEIRQYNLFRQEVINISAHSFRFNSTQRVWQRSIHEWWLYESAALKFHLKWHQTNPYFPKN